MLDKNNERLAPQQIVRKTWGIIVNNLDSYEQHVKIVSSKQLAFVRKKKILVDANFS